MSERPYVKPIELKISHALQDLGALIEEYTSDLGKQALLSRFNDYSVEEMIEEEVASLTCNSCKHWDSSFKWYHDGYDKNWDRVCKRIPNDSDGVADLKWLPREGSSPICPMYQPIKEAGNEPTTSD